MGKAKDEVKSEEYYKDIYFLYQILNTFENIEEVKIFMKDILTSSELRMLKRRWHIANLLRTGLDMRSIASEANTSTQTVMKVKRVLEEGHGGLLLALQRTEKKLLKTNTPAKKRIRGSSKYVKGWFSK